LKGWDGNRLIESIISRGTEEIKDRCVSICIATTGRRWPDLLKELSYVHTLFITSISRIYVTFSKVQIAGGLHERCTYLCFDVKDESSDIRLTPTTENQYFCSLYNQLLSANSTNSQSNYSLSQLFFVIKLFGYRTFIWTQKAFAFIQPRLNELKCNQPCQLIPKPIIFGTKQQMALRRRSAEHLVRYLCLMQLFTNALIILHSMNKNIINSCDGGLNEVFESEAKNKVNIHLNNNLCVFILITLHYK
jgi:hypothetical protein